MDFYYTELKCWGNDSSCVDYAAYDSDTNTLFVLLHSGLRRVYEGVDPADWVAFKISFSAGQHWNKWYRNGRFKTSEPSTTPHFISRESPVVEKVTAPVQFTYVVEFDVVGDQDELTFQATDDHDAERQFRAALKEFADSPFANSVDVFPMTVRRSL